MERSAALIRNSQSIAHLTHTRESFLRLAGGGVLTLAGLSLAGCGGDGGDGGGGGDGTIGVNLPFVQADVYPPLIRGAKEEGNARGYTVLESTTQLDANEQLGELNTWVARPVDAITVYPLDQNSLAPVVRRAQENDIAVVAYGVDLAGADGSTTFNEEQAAEIVGDAAGAWANENLGGEANVVTLTLAESETSRLRIDGALARLQDAVPGAKVVASAEAAAAPDALEAMQTILQGNPEANLLIAINDQDLIGASQALSQAGRDPESLWMGGFDGSREAMERILDGTIVGATAALQLEEIGRSTVSVPANILEGTEPTTVVHDYVLVSNDTPDLARRLIEDFEG